MYNFWNKRRVALLGGASLIGTHLGKALMEKDVSHLFIADDLSAGSGRNIKPLLDQGAELRICDLRNYEVAKECVSKYDIVFDLAAQHGGRGYVDTHSVELYDNLSLDTTIFRACMYSEVEKVIFSSSACAYPINIQTDTNEILKLSEDLIDYKNVQQPDGAYGLEKLVGEMTLDAYIKYGAFKGCSTRSFTVYGELMKESHAIAALIAKTMIKQDPFEVWGDGQQIRNWTYVEDNVAGALLAAEHLDQGAINIGIETRLTPMIACEIIWDYVGWKPNEIKFQPDKPVGVVNRVANSSKIKALGWMPKYTFEEGLRRTIDWYYQTHDETVIKDKLERLLVSR